MFVSLPQQRNSPLFTALPEQLAGPTMQYIRFSCLLLLLTYVLGLNRH